MDDLFLRSRLSDIFITEIQRIETKRKEEEKEKREWEEQSGERDGEGDEKGGEGEDKGEREGEGEGEEEPLVLAAPPVPEVFADFLAGGKEMQEMVEKWKEGEWGEGEGGRGKGEGGHGMGWVLLRLLFIIFFLILF